MSFAVKTPVFEGPLDLLLSLIEKRKLLINDVSLASVADDYMAHLQTTEKFPTHDVAQFVLIASTLVLIKSRSLLPEFILSSEEESDVKELERRLQMYKIIQEASQSLRVRFGKAVLHESVRSASMDTMIFAPHAGITQSALRTAVDWIIARFPKVEALKKTVVEKIMSLEDMMTTLSGRIRSAIKLRFSDFAKSASAHGKTEREVKVNTIVSFLAMLELVKQGILMVEQRGLFADIDMEPHAVATPDYSS